MDMERWRKLSPLLDAMLELDPVTRARSMALMREEDPALGNELAALLKRSERSIRRDWQKARLFLLASLQDGEEGRGPGRTAAGGRG